MKMQKLLSLDPDIVEDLKKVPNASKLVNDLLKDYFESGNLEKQEIKNKMDIIEKEIINKEQILRNLKARLKIIIEKEEELKEAFKDIPQIVMDDFRNFPKMTEDILRTRFREIYSDHYGLDYYKVLAAYKKYFNKDETTT